MKTSSRRRRPAGERDAVGSAFRLGSLALPVIGAGSGGFEPGEAERIVVETLLEEALDLDVVLFRYGMR